MNPDPLFEQFRREVEMHLPPLRARDNSATRPAGGKVTDPAHAPDAADAARVMNATNAAGVADMPGQGLTARLRAVRSLRSAARLVGCGSLADVFAAWENRLLALFEGTGTTGEESTNADALAGVEADILQLVEDAVRHPDPASWCTEHAPDIDSLRIRLESLTHRESPLKTEPATEACPDTAGHTGVNDTPATGLATGTDANPGIGLQSAASPRRRRTSAPSGNGASAPPPRQTSTLTRTSMEELFRTEATRQIGRMGEELVRLESGGEAAGSTETLMRAAHSLKGAARIVNRPDLVHLAHVLEDCFVAAQHGSVVLGAAETDVLLAVVDALAAGSRVSGEAYAEWCRASERERASLASALEAIRSGTFNPPPPVPAQPDQHPAPPERPLSSAHTEPPPAARENAPPHAHAPARQGATQPTREPPSPGVPPPGHPRQIRPATAEESSVRVPAEAITRLMGYAGEAVVQARSLQGMERALRGLGEGQDRLLARLRFLRQNAPSGVDPEPLARMEAWVQDVRGAWHDHLEEFDSHVRRGTDLAERMHREVLASRMRPFGDGVRGFPRMVRDLARTLDKPVDFAIHGEAVRVDRDVLEKLDAPLTHLLRNALDHGCQSTAARLAAGKPGRNRVTLSARHWAGFLNIRVEDDGAGIDEERVRQRIVSRGFHDAATVAGLRSEEVLEFLFLPGFSTSGTVTEISGRGVGLDVVRALLQELGGRVHVRNHPGHGVAFDLRLPVTRSIVRVLLLDVEGEPFAVPLNRIERVLTLQPEDVHTLEGKPYIHIDARNLPLVPAQALLGGGGAAIPAPPWPVVVLHSGQREYAMQVDRLLDERELVVRPLDPRLGHVRAVSAVLMLEDGALALLLDTEDLGETVDRMLGEDGTGASLGRRERGTPFTRGRVLVVEDSETVREMECAILRQAGYAVETAGNGAEGLLLARESAFDLVVSDVDMPRMTGLEFVRRLRGDPVRSATPVLILSYKDREEDRRAALEAGADAYLSKAGFDEAVFLEAVRGLTPDYS